MMATAQEFLNLQAQEESSQRKPGREYRGARPKVAKKMQHADPAERSAPKPNPRRRANSPMNAKRTNNEVINLDDPAHWPSLDEAATLSIKRGTTLSLKEEKTAVTASSEGPAKEKQKHRGTQWVRLDIQHPQKQRMGYKNQGSSPRCTQKFEERRKNFEFQKKTGGRPVSHQHEGFDSTSLVQQVMSTAPAPSAVGRTHNFRSNTAYCSSKQTQSDNSRVHFLNRPIPHVKTHPEKMVKAHIRRQIHYYFSANNLKTDYFLKSNMDMNGWVPVVLISTFNRVRLTGASVDIIVKALTGSTKVELSSETDHIRTRHNSTTTGPCKPSLQREFKNQVAEIVNQSP